MSTNVQVFKLQHKSMKDYITFMVFPGSGADLEGNLNPEMDEVLIEPESRKDLPLGPKGEWEECDLCEADRYSARTVYTLLTHCCGYSLVK